MAASRSRDSLPKRKPGKNRKEQLFNDVRGHLESRSLGFSAASAGSEGYEVVNTLTNCLWSIDANHDTLDKACSKKGSEKVPKLPVIWRKFTGHNDYKVKKKAKTRLHAAELHQTAMDLFRVAGRLTVQTEPWHETKQEIEGLAVTLNGYAEVLDEANDAQQERQKQKHPARQVCLCAFVYVCVCVCVCVCVLCWNCSV